MKILFLFTASILLYLSASSQSSDTTLRVLILSPYEFDISDECVPFFDSLDNQLKGHRQQMKQHLESLRNDHFDEYNLQPDYIKRMFENESSFIDSLTIKNYISFLLRNYVAHRLHKPFKIKPRLVFVSGIKSPSDIKHYKEIALTTQNDFIVNFPSITIYKEKGELRIKGIIELYCHKNNSVLLTQQNIGKPDAESADMPMYNDTWDCALVHSVYPAIFDCVKLISENR